MQTLQIYFSYNIVQGIHQNPSRLLLCGRRYPPSPSGYGLLKGPLFFANFPSPNGGSPSPNRISPTGSFRVVQLGLIRMGVDHENNFWQVQMTLTYAFIDFECILSHDNPFSQWKWILPYFFHPRQSAWSAVAILDCGTKEIWNMWCWRNTCPPPELRKAEERCECCFPMRMKSNSALKQILVSTSPELRKWVSCSETLKSFLDTLWQSWVNPSCHTQVTMYVGGLISRFQWDSVSFQWGGALQRFYIRSRGVAKAVSVFAKVKKSTNTETAMLSRWGVWGFLADCLTMSFVFVCWHSRKRWIPLTSAVG